MYTALIIDDEKPVQIAIQKLGNWKKYKITSVHTASNGRDGLLAMRELHPDICFVDMQMPIMNGGDYLKQASKEFPQTQFIVISGFDSFDYAQTAIKYGARDYLLKPVVQDELNIAIEKALLRINPDLVFDESDVLDEISPDEVIKIIKEYIDKNYNQNIKISMFADKYFFSKEYLSKLFKSKYECGIYEYVQNVRMERALELLKDDRIKVQAIAERLGYTDSHYFSKAFRNYYGISPSQFRNNPHMELTAKQNI